MKYALIASLVFNAVLVAIIISIFFTKSWDFVLFRKSSPTICSELYKIASKNGATDEFTKEYGTWCLEMADSKK